MKLNFNTIYLISLFSSLSVTFCFSQERIIDTPFKVNRSISIVNTETAYAQKKKKEVFEQQIPKGAVKDDLILVFIGCSGGLPKMIDTGWEKVLQTFPKRDPGDINVSIWYRVYGKGIPKSFKAKVANKTFITTTIVRGINSKNPLVDLAGEANTLKEKGKAVAPSVRGEKGGVTIAAFTFDDPYKVWVDDMYMISSWKQGDNGQAVGIQRTLKNGQTGLFETSKDPNENPAGGGHEVAATLTLRAKE